MQYKMYFKIKQENTVICMFRAFPNDFFEVTFSNIREIIDKGEEVLKNKLYRLTADEEIVPKDEDFPDLLEDWGNSYMITI